MQQFSLLNHPLLQPAHRVARSLQLAHAYALMIRRRLDDLLVCDLDADDLVGLLTRRSIELPPPGLRLADPHALCVADAMTPANVCYHDESLADALRLMASRHVDRVAVLHRNERVLGVLRLADVVRATPAAPRDDLLLQETTNSHGFD